MKNTGIFVGEKLDGNACFQPERTVSRGEFLAMLVRTLDIPTADADMTFAEEVPQWLRPYLAAALRAGITTGISQTDYDAPITGAEAALMLQNALGLENVEVFSPEEDAMTRADTALALYQAARLAPDAPGMSVIRKQG